MTKGMLFTKGALLTAACGCLALGAAAETDYRKAGEAEFKLAPVFADHMVLQQGVVNMVWGLGPNANYRISCKLNGVETWAHSDNGRHDPRKDGYYNAFQCFFPPMKAGGPYELIVSNEHSHAWKSVKDVWIGDVWLASGQSNMGFRMNRAKPGYGTETNALLRVYLGGTDKGAWYVGTPEDMQKTTAVGTFFGRALQKKLGYAIGVLDINCGGTWAENWMSRGALKRCPTTRWYVDEFELGQSDPKVWTPRVKVDKTARIVDTGRDPKTADWAKEGIDLSEWNTADMPDNFTAAFGRPVNGAAWFRRTVVLPKDWAGRDLVLKIPAVDKHDVTYFADVEVGRTGKDFEWEAWNRNRTYVVPGRLVKGGAVTIAIRMWSWVNGAGFTMGADHFSIAPKDGAGTPVELEGEWYARLERDLGNRGDHVTAQRRTYPDGMTVVRPSSWYERGLEPVLNYAIKGAVWYQGESNAETVDEARDYSTTLAAMVEDWRSRWGVGDFPFGIVQLANFQNARRLQKVSPWAELRDSQLWASREIPNAGLVCAIDVGQADDIHPVNKLAVGERLARWAFDQVYGLGDGKPYTGPRYLSGEVPENGSKVIVSFTEAEGGIIADGPVTGCFIRGEDEKWYSATVEIDGETLIVSAPEVKRPKEIRYGWSTNPLGATLKGKATGLPVFPFRWLKR